MTETWQVTFALSIAGSVLTGARKNARGPWLEPKKVPAHVMTRLACKPSNPGGYRYIHGGMHDVRLTLSTDPGAKLQRADYLTQVKALVQVDLPDWVGMLGFNPN